MIEWFFSQNFSPITLGLFLGMIFAIIMFGAFLLFIVVNELMDYIGEKIDNYMSKFRGS